MPQHSAIHRQFDRHAQNWQLLDSPLRPCSEDLHLMHKAFDAWHDGGRSARSVAPLRALLLGVTPEIATHEWGVPVDLTAVDISRAMIASAWPGDTATRRALCADWMDIPVAQHAFDMLLADGVFTLLDYPAGYAILARTVQRCLRHDGLFVLRAFCRPDTPETLPAVFDDLWHRRIGSFHALKWRLSMALQGDDIHRGIAVADIWQTFEANVPDRQHLAQATGWPIDVIATIDAYRDSAAIYTYPRVDELVEAVAPHLACTGRETGSYELAGRCPLLCFQPRPGQA
ncbi:MAG: class I SAM-dependent methyltransferase [Nitrosomonadales bacterium]|nr:class I SAM-dependent methyltransferase [Nitrosomonadales bacterium]